MDLALTFIWPTMLLSLISYGVCRLIPPATAATASTGSPLWQPGVGARTGGAGPACAATSRGALLAFADYLLVALALPQTVVVCPHRGHRYPGLRRFGSMAAEDLKPTRMEAAKVAAQDFVEHQPASVRIGVVAFSDGGCPSRRPPTMRAPSLPPSTASPHSAALAGQWHFRRARYDQRKYGTIPVLYSNLTPTLTLRPHPCRPGRTPQQ